MYLDESGYALTPPMTYTWALPGTRPLVKHESHRGQRVNVLAAWAAPGTTPQEPLCWQTAARTWKSEDVKAFLQDCLPGTAGPPRVVVLDNASIHRHGAMHTAPTELAAQQTRTAGGVLAAFPLTKRRDATPVGARKLHRPNRTGLGRYASTAPGAQAAARCCAGDSTDTKRGTAHTGVQEASGGPAYRRPARVWTKGRDGTLTVGGIPWTSPEASGSTPHPQYLKVSKALRYYRNILTDNRSLLCEKERPFNRGHSMHA